MIQRYTPSVYRFCARMLRDDEDARDAAQNTLVKVIRNLHRYDPERKFSTWVFGIARNTAIDEQRRRRFTTELGDRDLADTRSSPLEETSRQERAERLHEAGEDDEHRRHDEGALGGREGDAGGGGDQRRAGRRP